MPGAIIVGILIASGGAHGPGTAALVAALTEVLGPGPIVVEETLGVSDSEVLRMGEQLHAGAVVVVEEQGAPTSVHVRVHVIRDDRWIDRRMTFHTSDTAVERGRAVGLTVGSILVTETTVVAQGGGRDEEPPQDPHPAPKEKPVEATTAIAFGPRESSDSYHHAVELSLVGSTGVSGPAGGLGGTAHFEFALSEAVWPRFGGGGRVGPVAGLDGRDVAIWATVGGVWNPIRARDVGQLGLAVCLDAGMMVHNLSHVTAVGTSAHQVKALPAASLMVQGRVRIARSWELLVAVGSEVAFGSTDVWVATRRVATIPWVRGLATVGLRFGL